MSGDFEVWVIDADGTDLTQLTFNPGEDTAPAFSPDGQHDRVHPPRPTATDLEDEPRRLRADARQRRAGDDADWAPDGSHLLFFESADIWRVNPDGSGRAQVTNTPFWEDPAVYSPDMTKIVFASNEFDPVWDIRPREP